MKKNLIALSLALLLAASNCSAARLVITNNSNETIWARINNQRVISPSLTKPKKALFKQIRPGTNEIFHSSVFPIKKITFLKVVGSKTENMKRKTLTSTFFVPYKGERYSNNTMNFIYENYGNISATETTVKGIPATAYVNLYNNIRKIYTADDIEVTFPVVKTFTIKPKIRAINPNAKISYEGWKKTKRY